MKLLDDEIHYATQNFMFNNCGYKAEKLKVQQKVSFPKGSGAKAKKVATIFVKSTKILFSPIKKASKVLLNVMDISPQVNQTFSLQQRNNEIVVTASTAKPLKGSTLAKPTKNVNHLRGFKNKSNKTCTKRSKNSSPRLKTSRKKYFGLSLRSWIVINNGIKTLVVIIPLVVLKSILESTELGLISYLGRFPVRLYRGKYILNEVQQLSRFAYIKNEIPTSEKLILFGLAGTVNCINIFWLNRLSGDSGFSLPKTCALPLLSGLQWSLNSAVVTKISVPLVSMWVKPTSKLQTFLEAIHSNTLGVPIAGLAGLFGGGSRYLVIAEINKSVRQKAIYEAAIKGVYAAAFLLGKKAVDQ